MVENSISRPIDARPGLRLVARRAELGMSTQAVALSLGVPPAVLERIERGEASMDAGMIYDICTLLDITPSSLFGDLSNTHSGGPGG